MLDLYRQYMAGVTSGKITVCQYVRQAVERQLRDLKRQDDPAFPYYFDENEAADVLDMIGLFRHTSGEWEGQLFEIQNFQAFRWAVIFGWKKKSDNTRRFRRVYIEVARKQGKTEEAAAIGNLMTYFDSEARAQVFSAATTREQAREVFDAAKIMADKFINDSPAYAKRVRVLAHRIVDDQTNSFFTALAAEDKKLDGKGPHLAIIDEYHAHPTNAILKVLETGMGARRQPLSYIITTAGFSGVESPCYQLRKSLIDILSGRKVDETFFGVIYTLDETDDWNDKTKWIKANPNIGVTPKWDFMESEYTKAVNEGGTSEVEFKTKNLNIWTSSAETWIADEIWQACAGQYDERAIEGADCVGGLDLASVSDFSALCLRFHGDPERDTPIFKWWFWLPEAKVKDRARDLPDLLRWVNEGWIEVTPGNVTDYDYIRAKINEIKGQYNILSLGYDPHNALQIVSKLQQEDGLNMVEFSQSILHMSPPTKEFERRVRQRAINHGGNPVARWMLSNVEPWRDANGNIKLYKAKGKRELKIDGIVAAIMAEGEYLSADLTVYSSDIIVL